ncbi:MAG: hypothetical protein GXY52_05350 [Chloroflexi bacterium]|nr:hypothetical protein [Chloroflexota bacterium]
MSLLRLAVKRLLSHPFLTLIYIGSLTLCVALLVCPSLFSDSVAQAIMREELAISANMVRRPTFAIRIYAIPNSTHPIDLANSDAVRQWLTDYFEGGLGIPVRTTYVQNVSNEYVLKTTEGDRRYSSGIFGHTKVAVVPKMGEHVETVSGTPYGEETVGELLNVWVMTDFAAEVGIEAGDVFEIAYPSPGSEVIRLRVAGIVQPRDSQEEYWYQKPDNLLKRLLLTNEAEYNAHIASMHPEGVDYVFWYLVFDDTHLNLTHAARYIDLLERVKYELDMRLPLGRMDVSPLDELEAARLRKRDLSLTLGAVTIPLLVILAQFLLILANTFARAGARHDSTLMSRGTSRLQLLLLALTETAIILLISVPAGMWLGLTLAGLLGLADGFLSFGRGQMQPVFVAAIDWPPVVIAVGLGLLTRVGAAMRHARISVVEFEHRSAGREAVMTGMRLFGLALLAGISAYTYRQLVTVGGIPLLLSADTALAADPLLLVAPSLFIITGSLFLAEATGLVVGGFGRLLDPILSANAVVAFRHMAREHSRSRAPVFLLVVSLSLGIFYASLAYSAQINLRDRMRHSVGADITFEQVIEVEQVGQTTTTGELISELTDESDARNLLASDYEEIEGVLHASRVANYDARVRVGGSERRTKLIGIERTTFRRATYLRSDYAEVPLGELMNQLALNPQGALVPKWMLSEYGLRIGDPLSVPFTFEDIATTLSFTIVGTFEYFPTVGAKDLAVVTNIDTIFEGAGLVLPHSIWLRTTPQADPDAIVRTIDNRGVTVGRLRVLKKLMAVEQGRKEYVGTLGMMSVSFVASLIIAALGTLVHLFAGLMHNRGEFAVMRGLGFQLPQVIVTVLLEYMLVIIAGLVWGSTVGLATVRLYGRYIPLIPPGESLIPPFVPYSDTATAWWIVFSMAITSAALMVIIYHYLRSQRLFEVLRMGQQ